MLIVSPAGEAQDTECGEVVQLPFGTVSLYVDRAEGVLRIFCEQEPNEIGWQMALDYAREVSDGYPPDEYMDGEVVVFVFRLGEDAGPHRRSGTLRPWLIAAATAAAPLALAACSAHH